jgi:hypothetical protein
VLPASVELITFTVKDRATQAIARSRSDPGERWEEEEEEELEIKWQRETFGSGGLGIEMAGREREAGHAVLMGWDGRRGRKESYRKRHALDRREVAKKGVSVTEKKSYWIRKEAREMLSDTGLKWVYGPVQILSEDIK